MLHYLNVGLGPVQLHLSCNVAGECAVLLHVHLPDVRVLAAVVHSIALMFQ